MNGTAIDPTVELEARLQKQEWDTLVDQLANGPWRIVNPLIVKLASQLAVATTRGAGMQRAMRSNGEQMATDPS